MTEIVFSIISTVVSAFIGWLIGRRERKAIVVGHELENIEKAIGIYRTMITDLQKEIMGMENQMHNLQKRLQATETKLKEAEMTIEEYKKKYNN